MLTWGQGYRGLDSNVPVQPNRYGVLNVPKTLRNAVFVYPPLIYRYDTDLAKYLPDLYKSGSDL